MIRITAKLKIAAGLAAGALTLGAAGAYAAANANNTITIDPSKSVSLTNGQTTLKLVALNGANTNLTLPTSFKDQGQCVSWFATKHNYAVAPTSGTTVSKNYHGKLISTIKGFCTPLVTSTKTDNTKTETPDATESDSDSLSGTSHGHGHAYGHGKHVAD